MPRIDHYTLEVKGWMPLNILKTAAANVELRKFWLLAVDHSKPIFLWIFQCPKSRSELIGLWGQGRWSIFYKETLTSCSYLQKCLDHGGTDAHSYSLLIRTYYMSLIYKCYHIHLCKGNIWACSNSPSNKIYPGAVGMILYFCCNIILQCSFVEGTKACLMYQCVTMCLKET